MHVLFVHQNFPAQFGHIAAHLAKRHGYQCSFVNERRAGKIGEVECIQYKLDGGATKHNHYCTRTFENATRHAMSVYEAMKGRPDIKPDLVVGHSGFGSTLFLRELYPDTPIINYFEYFYRTRHSDMDFRKEYPPQPLDFLAPRSQCNWPARPRQLRCWLQPDGLPAQPVSRGIPTQTADHLRRRRLGDLEANAESPA